MLLGTITLRSQSKPAAGETEKQTRIIPHPALLSSQNTTGQIRKTKSALSSAVHRDGTVLSPALAMSLALLEIRRLAAAAQPGIYQPAPLGCLEAAAALTGLCGRVLPGCPTLHCLPRGSPSPPWVRHNAGLSC